MRKDTAIRLFGTTQTDLARVLGISRQAVSKWPDELQPEQEDRVVGAAVRLGLWPDRLIEVVKGVSPGAEA